MPLEKYICHTSSLIEEQLEALVQLQPKPYQQLFAAARYSLLGPGKRMRPIILIASAEALGAHASTALSAACAIEMVHTYSLIHDDLPCMDNDDFRRGIPTLHKAFPEAYAVLAGDFLLTYAFEVIVNDSRLTPLQQVSLVSMLAKGSGGNGMIAGQIMDIEAEGKTLDQEKMELIHHHKTGALITAAAEMGGVIAHARSDELAHLRAYGEAIGLAFQIVDDILDVTPSAQAQGKKCSSDERNDKMTYVKLLGLNGAKAKAYALAEHAKKQIALLSGHTEILQALANRIVARIEA